MGVYYDCEICENGRAGEFEKINEQHVCTECQEKAMEIGTSQLKMGTKETINNMLNNLNNQFDCKLFKTQLDYDCAFNVCKYWFEQFANVATGDGGQK